jgi:polyferredoxin
MDRLKKNINKFLIILIFSLIPAVVCQFFVKKPVDKYIHITSFRYGKTPYAIRCNRGDRLHLTFSTKDTGHSFYLEEFDIDVKITPAREEVAVFRTSDPTIKPVMTKEVILTARHSGIANFLVSKSNYRCHVWCGPMHAFEQGKLVIFPNTLLFMSLGSIAGIILIWILGFFGWKSEKNLSDKTEESYSRINIREGFFRKAIISRWPQVVLILLMMLLIYIVILTSMFGTKVAGRNLGVLLMWSVWLFVLVAVLTPLFGRVWCTICPLPFFGDFIQRRSIFNPLKGKKGNYNNKYSGAFLKWPEKFNNEWVKLLSFMIFATFSTTLVAVPKLSGTAVILLFAIPTVMGIFWELRAFCRYVCPVSVFVSPFGRMSPVALRSLSQDVCDQCKPHFCQNGNINGWACPYGLNVGRIRENSDCGLCLECFRSCTYNNVALYKRPFASETGTRSLSEAWLSNAIFTISIIYSILYLGPWPAVRDFVNIMDKHNWGLFGIYLATMWLATLVAVPGIIYLLSILGKRISKIEISLRNIFLGYSGLLMPLGLMLWIAFVIPMFFVNKTFILMSASDPFGWGWDFFGTANMPWHQLCPQCIPWFQAILVLTGVYLSLRNTNRSWNGIPGRPVQKFLLSLPAVIFILIAGTGMIIFFTN